MDILLVALQVSFFLPVLVRVSVRTADALGKKTSLLAEFHGLGLLLLWAGIAFALVEGRVFRAVTVRGVLGAVLIVCAVLLMAWSITALRSWRLLPTIDAGHELCTTGPYGLVRHPMYLAIDLLGLGSAVWAATPVVILGTLFLVIGGDFRARLEEKVLLAAFKDRYRHYMRRVRRMVPGIY